MKLLYDSNKDNQFIRIIQLVYHELWHIVQAQKYKNNFLEFIVELEACVKCIKPEHYKRNHDNYFMEIDADYNAIQKTKEYLNRHPEILTKSEETLNYLDKEYRCRLVNYDFDTFFNIFCECKTKNEMFGFDECLWYQIFFGKGESLKRIDEILNDERFNILDKKIVNSIISSDKFLSTIDFSELNNNEKDILRESLEYKVDILKRQCSSEFLQSSNGLEKIHKIQKLEEYINGLDLKKAHY